MNVDPQASMRCWALTVDLAGREFEIPALPAADWWPILENFEPSKLVDVLMSTSGLDLDAMLLDGTITGKDLTDAFTDVIEEVTGRSSHATLVLITVAGMHWPAIGGAIAQTGFRWDVQPIGAALDAIYATIVGGMSEDGRNKFLALLDNESLTQPGKKRAPSQRVMSEFEAMAGPRPAAAPVPGKSTAELSGNERPRTRTRPRPPRQGVRSAAPRKQP